MRWIARPSRAAAALALTVTALWAAVILSAVTWVHAQGGVAAGLTRIARTLAGAPSIARAATLMAVRALPPPAPALAVAAADPDIAARCADLAAGCAVAASVGDPGSGFAIGSDDSDGHRLSFAIVTPESGGHHSVYVDNGGSSESLDRLSRAETAPFVWFSQDGEEYVVRDRDLVERARRIVQPIEDLGRRMGDVGRREGEIGASEGRFGAYEGRIGALQGRLGALEARLALEDRRGDDVEGIRAELRELQAGVRALQSEARALRAGSVPVGRDHEALRARMQSLRAEHRETRIGVRTRMRDLLEEARRQGKAERLHAEA